MSDSSPLERVAAVATDSCLLLDVGFGSEQFVFRMNAKSPFPPGRRSNIRFVVTSENRRIIC